MKSLAVGKVLVWLSSAAMLLMSIGCGAPPRITGPFALRRENARLKAAVQQYRDQLAQSKLRSDNLDADNEGLHNLLAREQEQLRSQPGYSGTTGNMGLGAVPPSSWNEPKEFGPAGSRPTGHLPGQSRATASRADSEAGWLPLTNITGADVFRDGDMVRIRLTNAPLFDPGKATLKPTAVAVLSRVASTIRRHYPGYLVGIEGHTDADPIRKSNWRHNHELSVRRAMAVYEYLRNQVAFPSEQLFVAGYGPNLPMASNYSASGKARNRRVEFVIYPIDAQLARERGFLR